MIARAVIAKGSLFFLERTESDGFESQPGGVDVKSQGTLLLSATPKKYFMCSQITTCVFAPVSTTKLNRVRLFVLTFLLYKKWKAA